MIVRIYILEKGLKMKWNGAEDGRLLREIEERLRPRSARALKKSSSPNKMRFYLFESE